MNVAEQTDTYGNLYGRIFRIIFIIENNNANNTSQLWSYNSIDT